MNGDLHLVAGLFEHLAIQPAEGARTLDAARNPQRVIGVLGENYVMRREARADQRELAARGIVHGELPAGRIEREHFRRRMVRALLAEVRVGGRTHARGHPDTAFLVHHLIVYAGLAVPDGFGPPIRRRRHRVGFRRRRLRITYRVFDLRRRIRHRIEHREIVRTFFGRAVELAIGVDGGFAPVGRDQVMHITGGRTPVPQREHNVALHALRPRGFIERKFAGGDPIGPVSPQCKRPVGI